MARGVNKVILVGNLGADPEVRYMPNGNAVANVRLATTEQWKDKQSGDTQERTEWHRVVMFGRLGEIAGEYLRKGSQIYVEGKIQTRKWQGQDGQDRYSTEIVASEMQMLGGRGGSGGSADFNQDRSGSQGGGGPGRGSQGSANQGAAKQGGSQDGGSQSGGYDDFDDDIPF